MHDGDNMAAADDADSSTRAAAGMLPAPAPHPPTMRQLAKVVPTTAAAPPLPSCPLPPPHLAQPSCPICVNVNVNALGRSRAQIVSRRSAPGVFVFWGTGHSPPEQEGGGTLTETSILFRPSAAPYGFTVTPRRHFFRLVTAVLRVHVH